MTILVMTTGGTIGALPYHDPKNPPEFSSMPEAGRDIVANALNTVFAAIDLRCVSLDPRDSKLIDDDYRRKMLAIVEDAPEQLILITHGTDTLLQTADFFHHYLTDDPARNDKTVVITGAMTPLANGAESDGYMNVAFSLDCLTRSVPDLAKTNIVLCDFDQQGKWTPRLYPYQPNRYEKFYDADGRYNRLRLKS